MSLHHTFGSACELAAAGQIYPYVFEVYRNRRLFAKFGIDGYPVLRLRFSQDLSEGHFDAYLPTTLDVEQENDIISILTPSRISSLAEINNTTVKKQRKHESSSYHANQKENFHDQSNPGDESERKDSPLEVEDLSSMPSSKCRRTRYDYKMRKYQHKNVSLKNYYEKKKVSSKDLLWTNKVLSGMIYKSEIAYEADKILDIAAMSKTCTYCKALKWKDETPGMCCSSGKVQLTPLKPLPEPLYSLITGLHPEHQHFMDCVRKYNSCFQMTSFGASKIIEHGFMPTFKVQGQVYHLIGSLLPLPEQSPKFLQIYFVGEDEREARLRCSSIPGVKKGLVKVLQTMLHNNNPYIRDLKISMEKVPKNSDDFQVVIHADRIPAHAHEGCYNPPTVNEVALVIVGQQFEKRDIVIQSRDNKLQQISEVHRSYDALQYPLLFCYGEDGYSIDVPMTDPNTKYPLLKTVSAANFYSYRLMMRQGELNHLLYYRALLSQYIVDMYAKIETERLNYIRHNQAKLRADSYMHLKDAIGRQDTDIAQLGQMIVLPSTFTGSPRYMHEKTQDAMTYVRHYGRPDLFITFTCNPRWQEILNSVLPGQKPHDRHDIISRVFHLKIKTFMGLLTKSLIFGKVRCYMYSVEWQKRGLPHIHILLWQEQRITSDKIDKIISAEIPDPAKDPILYDIVKSHMIHGLCGNLNVKSPCMKAGNCTKKYPRPLLKETQTGDDGYPKYRRRAPSDGGFTVQIRGMTLDNRWVVPYNPVLSRAYSTHINVEYCNSVQSIKYICKYVNKGSDQATFGLENNIDEVKLYESGRYISSSEAVWRILAFPIHERFPTIIHLAVHLENGQRIYFNPNEPTNLLNKLHDPPKTTLLAFFELCKSDNFAKTLLYVEVPSFYVWKNNRFERRKRGDDVVGWPGLKKDKALGRVYTIHPNNTECYHLRLLLHEIRGPTSFLELKTVNGKVHPTFQSACKELGLLEDDRHWDATMEEAAIYQFPYRLRELFAVLLLFCQITDAKCLWEKHKNSLSEDIRRQVELDSQMNSQTLEEVYNKCLMILEETVLSLGGKTLHHYGLPQPTNRNIIGNKEYMRELNYDPVILEHVINEREKSLTKDQSNVYDVIIKSVKERKGKIFFLDAPGGTGKTFILNLLLAKVRKEKGIALAVASSGIAATLLEGGKTAHSAFKLPLNLGQVENPVCNIAKQSNTAQVLKECQLIVWDESTMAHKSGLEALNTTLKDIRGNSSLMGGVTVLLAGDFRQTLPVISRGTRADEVKACLKSSYLWPHIINISLRQNMRVHLGGKPDETFADLLIKIGNGIYPSIEGKITVSSDLAMIVTTLKDLTTLIYPDIVNINSKSIEWLCERAILCPKNDRASVINNILLQAFDGEEVEYRSVDAVVQQDDAVHYPTEFLNSLNPSGLPSHKLSLKIGTPVMLLRNLNPPKLCNGTRLQIRALHKYIVEATVISGCAKGEIVYIPKIPLIPSEYPFEFKRIQFPLKLCFAMTINKAQGQTLKTAGIDLSENCFSHGQLYVACSRVSSASSLVILAPTHEITNVVYKEVLS